MDRFRRLLITLPRRLAHALVDPLLAAAEACRVRRLWRRLARDHGAGIVTAPAAAARAVRPGVDSRWQVLFVTEKWCDGNPAMGSTNSEHNLYGSLDTTGLAEMSFFHFDQYWHQHRTRGDQALLERCLESRPDVLVLTWLPCGRRLLNPAVETLRLLRRHLGIPIVGIWFDTALPGVWKLAEAVAPHVDVNVTLDSTTAFRRFARDPARYLPMWTPEDPRLFCDPGLARDLDLSFMGSVKGYGDRSRGLAQLETAGLRVHRAGGERGVRVPVAEYARVFQRSRISLNFSGTVNRGPLPQAKGRIFEVTLCGALLLEGTNPETAKWFEPMVEYVPFTDEHDLVEKTRYYLAHEDERLAIARRGQHRAQTDYSANRFWTTLFERVGLPIPPAVRASHTGEV